MTIWPTGRPARKTNIIGTERTANREEPELIAQSVWGLRNCVTPLHDAFTVNGSPTQPPALVEHLHGVAGAPLSAVNAITTISLGFVIALIARVIVPGMRFLPRWMPLSAGMLGAFFGGLAGSLLVRANPLQLDSFDPVGLACSFLGALFSIGALEARALRPRW